MTIANQVPGAEYPERRQLEWGDELDKDTCFMLLDELDRAARDATMWQQNADLAEDTVEAQWGGMSDDGLKHDDPDDPAAEEVYPWDGSSDARIRITKRLVLEAKRIAKKAWRMAQVRLTATESGDEASSQKLTTVLRWAIRTQMRDHFNREQNLAAYWRGVYGVCHTLVDWERTTNLELTELDLAGLLEVFGLGQIVQGIAKMLGAMDPNRAIIQFLALIEEQGGDEDAMRLYEVVKDAMDLIENPERRGELLEQLGELFPTVKEKYLENAVMELISTGVTKLPQPIILENRPRRRTLLPFRDCFASVGIECGDDAWWFCVREVLSESELEEMALTEEWDEEFIEELIENGDGETILGELQYTREESARWNTSRKNVFAAEDNKEWRKGYFEVFYFYHFSTDPSTGVKGLYQTILSPHAWQGDWDYSESEKPEKVLCAKHGLFEDPTGKMPIIDHVWCRTSKTLYDNTGIAMDVYTHQQEIKTQRDARTNWTTLRIEPMWRRHPRDRGERLTIAPRGELVEYMRGATAPVELPDFDLSDSKEIEAATTHDANLTIGSMADGDVPEIYAVLFAEDIADDWLDEEARVVERIWQLCQKNLEETDMQRIAGPSNQPLKVTLPEIRGAYDFQILFDAEVFNPEMREKKLKLLFEILMRDTVGAFDRRAALADLLTLVDVRYAERWITPEKSQEQKEIQDELFNLTMILSGVAPPMIPEGQNYGLRLQVIQQQINSDNPNKALLRLVANRPPKNADPDELEEFKQKQEILNARLQHLQHMVDQQTVNKEAGIVGAKRVIG